MTNQFYYGTELVTIINSWEAFDGSLWHKTDHATAPNKSNQEVQTAIQNQVIVIVHDNGGFGQTYNPDTTRPFSFKIGNGFARSKNGAVRSFATREAATKAAQKLNLDFEVIQA